MFCKPPTTYASQDDWCCHFVVRMNTVAPYGVDSIRSRVISIDILFFSVFCKRQWWINIDSVDGHSSIVWWIFWISSTSYKIFKTVACVKWTLERCTVCAQIVWSSDYFKLFKLIDGNLVRQSIIDMWFDSHDTWKKCETKRNATITMTILLIRRVFEKLAIFIPINRFRFFLFCFVFIRNR